MDLSTLFIHRLRLTNQGRRCSAHRHDTRTVVIQTHSWFSTAIYNLDHPGLNRSRPSGARKTYKNLLPALVDNPSATLVVGSRHHQLQVLPASGIHHLHTVTKMQAADQPYRAYRQLGAKLLSPATRSNQENPSPGTFEPLPNIQEANTQTTKTFV